MFIKQISVFLENHPGALREMTELLGKGGVDLLALSVADTQNFGIIRIIVSDAQSDSALLMLNASYHSALWSSVIRTSAALNSLPVIASGTICSIPLFWMPVSIRACVY